MNRKKREQLILESALRIFSRQGYSKTSVADIIDGARVARGTFYLYFKSKKDLFKTLFERFMNDVSRDVAKISALNMQTEGDWVREFRAMASDLIGTITKNRLLAKLILVDAGGDPEFSGKLQIFYDQLATIIRHNLNINIQNNLFRPCNTDVVARCMMGCVKEIVTQWIRRDELELEPTIQGVIDFLLNGIHTIGSIASEKVASIEEPKRPPANINMH